MASPQKVICPACNVALTTAGLPPGKPFRCPKCSRRIEYPSRAAVAVPATVAAPRGRASLTPVVVGGLLLATAAAGGFLTIRGWNKTSNLPTAQKSANANPTVIAAGQTPGPQQEVASGAATATGAAPSAQLAPMIGRAPARPLDFGKPIVLSGHRPGSTIVDLAYAPDGSKLASITAQGEIILWNLRTQEGLVIARNLDREGQATKQFGIGGKHLFFSPDSKTLFSGHLGEVSLWDAETGFGRAKIGGDYDTNDDLIVSPTGTTLVTNHPEDEKRYGFTVWDIATAKPIFIVEYSRVALNHFLRYSLDGNYLALFEKPPTSTESPPTAEELAHSGIRIFDLAARKEIPRVGLPTFEASFIANNRFITWPLPVSNDDSTGQIKKSALASFPAPSLWAIPTGGAAPRQENASELSETAAEFPEIVLSRDGSRMAFPLWRTRNKDSTRHIVVRDAASLKSIADLSVDGGSAGFIFSGNGAYLLYEVHSNDFPRGITLHAVATSGGNKRSSVAVPMDPDPDKSLLGYEPLLAASPSQAGTVAVALPDAAILIQPFGDAAPAAPKTWTITPASAEVKSGNVQLITTAPFGFKTLAHQEQASFPLAFRYDGDTEIPLALSPDGRLALAAGTLANEADDAVSIFDIDKSEPRGDIRLGFAGGGGDDYRFTPDGRYLFNNSAVVVDLHKKQVVPRPDDLGPLTLDLTADGQHLAVGVKHAAGEPAQVLQFRALSSLATERTALEAFEGELRAIKYGPDHKSLVAFVVQRGEGKLLLLDPDSGQVRKTLAKMDEAPEAAELAFAPNGLTLALLSSPTSGDVEVSIWDVAHGKMRHRFAVDLGSTPRFIQNGRQLVATRQGEAAVYDVATGNMRALCSLSELSPKVECVCPARNLLAAGYVDGRVVLWDLAQNAKLAEFNAHSAPVLGIQLSPDGRTLVTAGKENRLKVWSLQTK